MLFKKIFFILILLVISNMIFSNDTPDADDIIRLADKVRNPSESFKMQINLIEYRSNKETQRMTFSVFSKPDEETGEFNTIVKFLEPSKDRGKLMLKDGGNIWFYDPVSKSTARISPQQRLLGQTSNGDVMTINLSVDYNAEIKNEQTIANADRQQVETYMLELSAKVNTANYHRIEYWVEKETAHPIRGYFYSASDRLLKIIFYRNYQDILGKLRPTEAIIIDGVDRNFVTRMLCGNYEYIKIKDEYFQRSMLPNFNL